ncbi:MAG TPA: tetratricopeptide repeat protein [Vicinamibacterales bacterium]|jgi:Flp pilus assembly protein TadD|nr:tetratricopeptide repeat protein [Vicinamibacterales bacterium]
MRTHLYRGVLALAVALVFSAPALAQGIVKGKVVDDKNQPVADAKVTIQGPARNAETKTNNKGEFVQVGLQSGRYTVTVVKDKVGQAAQQVTVSQGTPAEANFTLTPTSGMSPEQKAIQEAAGAAIEALRAGRDDEAITKLNDVVGKLPTCSDCYYNLGLAYTHKQQWAEAETALKKSIELKATNPDPYNGLANVYNAQKRFDEALAMNQKATELAGSTAGAGGGNAEAIYNQGVVLFNAGKYADAKVQFENATKADPNNANAFYQLGMTNLNLGQIPEAVTALETFLKLAPTDPKAAQVQGSLPALQQMIKK